VGPLLAARQDAGGELRLAVVPVPREDEVDKRSYERADLHVTITGLDPEASAAAIDARLSGT